MTKAGLGAKDKRPKEEESGICIFGEDTRSLTTCTLSFLGGMLMIKMEGILSSPLRSHPYMFNIPVFPSDLWAKGALCS